MIYGSIGILTISHNCMTDPGEVTYPVTPKGNAKTLRQKNRITTVL